MIYFIKGIIIFPVLLLVEILLYLAIFIDGENLDLDYRFINFRKKAKQWNHTTITTLNY